MAGAMDTTLCEKMIVANVKKLKKKHAFFSDLLPGHFANSICPLIFDAN